MPAIGGEPWRAAARADVFITAVPANRDSAWVTTTVGSAQPTGDQALWEGAPGDTLTLRFKWQSEGTGSAQQAPTFATVECRLPGGGIVGAAWTVAFPAAGVEVTRTFHFDDAPLSGVLDVIRSGMLEVYLNWGSTGGLAPWNVDSRGGSAGVLVTNDEDFARGYVRSTCIVSNNPAPSNVAIDGASPALFATPDPIHTRITFSAVKYRAHALELELLRAGGGVMERESTLAAQTAVNHDFSWTGTTGANRRVGNGMFLGSETKDLRVTMATLGFGGDNEYVFAASGHEAGWTVDAELQLTNPSELTVDPRLNMHNSLTDMQACLFYNQMTGVEFLDPPSSGNQVSGQRQFPQAGFVGVRYSNARGEGQNSLSVTLKMWDYAELGGSEGSPQHTSSGTTVTRRDPPPAVVTPEAGWLPLAASGGDENKLPITWTTVIAGQWKVKSVLTAPTDLTGLEIYPESSGGSFWNRTLALISLNPNLKAVTGSTGFGDQRSHFNVGVDPLFIGFVLYDAIVSTTVPLDEPPETAVLRFNFTALELQYLDPADMEWKSAVGATIPRFVLDPTPDPNTWAKVILTNATSPAAALWTTDDLFVVSAGIKDGTPYVGHDIQLIVGNAFAHDGGHFGVHKLP